MKYLLLFPILLMRNLKIQDSNNLMDKYIWRTMIVMLIVLLATTPVFPNICHIRTQTELDTFVSYLGLMDTHPGPWNCPLGWEESRSWLSGNLFVANFIAYQLVNFVSCYNACMFGISGKYNDRIVKVNLNYGRSYKNQVK